MATQRRGFTLVELMVVLAVIGIIVGMSVPGLTAYARDLRLKTATRQIMGLLGLARSTAITRHAESAVIIDQAQHQVRVVESETGEAMEQMVRLPGAVTVTVAAGGEDLEESQIVFRATGALTGRTVTLTVEEDTRHQTITVTGATGAIMLESQDR